MTTDAALPDQPRPLDDLIGNHARALMLLLWKQRHTSPGFTFEVHPQDIEGFDACVKYLEVSPQVRMFRPGGVPAQAPVPAHGNRRAIPGRDAIPPKPYVVVQMVDQDGNTFVSIENNEDDYRRAQTAAQIQRVTETAMSTARQLRADIASRTYSDATLEEAAVAITTLCKALGSR